jgi:hypothetical protein
MPVDFDSDIAFHLLCDRTAKKNRPNKALEPTPTAVTPRAIDIKVEAKTWICSRYVARGAPAAVVAHL